MDRWTLGLVLLCCFGITVYAADNIVRRGNKLVGSRSGVDVAGAIFLMRDGTLTDGILFAVRAFFRSDSPIRFQVWRPVLRVNDTTRQFKLVGEIRVIPSVIDRVEDVYLASVNIASRECLRVRDGDQLGIYMEESPGAVAYAFDPSNPMALGYTLDNTSVPLRVNDTVLFDSLTFPYDFSLAAYVYTDLTGVDPNDETPPCPRVLIPNDEGITFPTSQAPTPPTGAPGATGPIGPQGFTGATGMQGMPGRNGFTGDTGPQGPKGNAGDDGATGPMGPRGSMGVDGATGATGPQGPKGDRGEPGPPGNSQGGAEPDAEESKSMFTDPMMVMGLLIWLILVTLMLMVVLLLLIYFVRRNREDDKEKIKTSTLDEGAIRGDKKRPVSVHSTARPLWMDSMKEEQSKDYTIDTIERDNKDKVVFLLPPGSEDAGQTRVVHSLGLYRFHTGVLGGKAHYVHPGVYPASGFTDSHKP